MTYLSPLPCCELLTQDWSSRTLNGASFISGATLRCPLLHLKTYRGKEGAGTRGNWVTHKPWCLVRCSPLRRRPCLSRVDRVLQSSPDWPQRSIQSWQASCSQENTLSCDTERLQTPECVFLWLYLMFILEYFSTTQISTMQSFTLYISAYLNIFVHTHAIYSYF